MQPAAARAVDAGDGELGPMRIPPIARVAVPVDVEHIDPGRLARAHGHELPTVAAPQFAEDGCIRGRV